MRKNEYRKRQAHAGELRTPVIFYDYRPDKNSPYPDEKEYSKEYECWGKIDRVWMKDMQEAKMHGNESDLTITIRDPLQEFIPNNNHFVKIETFDYKDLVYNVTSTQPDLQHRDFIKVIAELKDDMKWQ